MTRAGGILLEVEDTNQATLLTEKLQATIGEDARVRMPESLTPILLLNIPEWATAEDVIDGLLKTGINPPDDGSQISIRKNAGGRGALVAKVNLPFQDAVKAVEAKQVVVGWTRCKIKPIESAQPTCFICQEKGHFAARCVAVETAERKCFRCRSTEHVIKDCQGKIPQLSENRKIQEPIQETPKSR